MKKLFTLYALLAVLAGIGFSCSEEEDNGGNNNGGNNQDKQVVEVNQDDYYKYEVTFIAKGTGTMTVLGEASFRDEKCTAVVFRYVYPNALLVQQLWESMRNDEALLDELQYYSWDEDKTLTYRLSEETVAILSQRSRAEVCEFVKTSVQTTIKRNFGV